MSRVAFACLTLLLLQNGCMTTTTHYATRSVGQEEITLESAHNLPSVMGDFSYEQGVIRGHVGWTYDCRRAVIDKQVTEIVEVQKPNKAGAVGSMFVGAFVGALSVALLSAAGDFSDEETCSTDSDGNYSCSSPRTRALAVGTIGVLSSAAFVGAGVVTLGTKSKSSVVSSDAAPPVVARIKQDHVACGLRPIEGLGLSAVRGDERIASSTTNAQGDVAFAIPPNVTGGLTMVVDFVPVPIQAIHIGDVVGTAQVEALRQDQGSDKP